MKLIDLKVLEGRNIKGDERLIYINIGESQRKELYWLINNYEFICRKINIEGNLREVIYNEFGGEAWLTYLHKELSLFIIENLIDGMSTDDLLIKAISVKSELWDYQLIHECNKNEIDFFKNNSDSVIVGYGVNSKIITKKLFEDKKYNLKLKGDGDIPIISVTGTNGKTSTSKLLYNTLKKLGYITGLASTGSIIINDEIIKKGDTTGFYSAKSVLTNPSVEVGVLETARGGILRKGLGFKRSRVAIITSLTEDHIGSDGINTLEDLMDIKLITVREVIPSGKVVIKSDKKLYDILQTKDNLVLFNFEKDECIEKHIKNKKEAWYVEAGNIVWFDGKSKVEVAPIEEFEFTHEGKSKSNINNVISTIISVFEIHNNLQEVINAVKGIKCDINTNLGRQNILNIGNFKMLLDYGHNPEAFSEVYFLAQSLKKRRIISIISSPGDRLDEYIKELGRVTGANSDLVIIKETFDRRGRNPLEITNLLCEGIRESNDTIECISIVDEKKALEKALLSAKDDDIIVNFSQHLDVIIPVINEHLKSLGEELIDIDLEGFH